MLLGITSVAVANVNPLMKKNYKTGAWKKWTSGSAVVAILGGLGYLALNSLEKPADSTGEISSRAEGTPSGLTLSDVKAGKALGASGATALSASVGTGKATLVLKPKGAPVGASLPAAGVNPDADKGRVVKLDPVAVRNWGALKQGATLSLPTANGETLEGTVNLVQEDSGWVRMGGSLANGKGSFSLNTNFNEVAGMILMPDTGTGYQIQMDGGEVVLVERRLSSLVCFPAPNDTPALGVADTTIAPKSAAASGGIPLINTRPGAKGVIYVDFGGATVTDTVWNSGRPITAAPSSLSGDQITQVLNLAAPDWAPFDVTLTTDSALYDATAPGLRMHVVVTPTNTASPGAGGVAYVNSWSGSGKGYSSNVVCWVFNQSVKTVAEALSHEVGHTVGLNHDGQTGGVAYYSGHGGTLTTPTSWAPIMGSGYSKSLVQWSKGEYVSANNTEDDLAIIGKAANQFGFVSNELPNGLKALPLTGNSFQVEGLLRGADSVDTWKFSTSGGQLTATARPSVTDSDVDVQLELTSSSGATVVLSSLVDALSATVNQPLAAGDYTLVVRPAGTGAKPAGGYTTGYSSYASVGRYTLSGSVQGAITVPVFTSPTAVSGTAGQPLSFTVAVTPGSTVTVESSTLPSGLSFNPATLILSGTPAQETGSGTAGTPGGPGLLKLAASNASGISHTEIVVSIAKATLPLTGAFPIGTVTSTQAAPWTGLSMTRADGTTGTVAQSGVIANNGQTTVRIDYTPQSAGSSLATFYWKASSEALSGNGNSIKGDGVTCRVDGVAARDAETGLYLTLSGETGWVRQTVRLEGAGTKRIEFTYAKDATLSAGQDRVWVYMASIGQPPLISKSPVSVALAKTDKAFTLTAEVAGATSIVWKKDSATLSDGITKSGSTIAGAQTSTLKVTNASGSDAGSYWLEAKNAYGTVMTRPVDVLLALPPVFTQQPAVPVGLKVGDPLTLSAMVSGGPIVYYRLNKDGVAGSWNVTNASSVSFILPKTTAASAGKYSITALNAYGQTTSDTVVVSFATVTPAKTTAK